MTFRLISKGFTFIELVVVVLIMSIAAGLSVPLLKSRFDSAKIEDCAYNLERMFNYAWQRSIDCKRRVRVCVDAPKKAYWLEDEIINDGKIDYVKVNNRYAKERRFPDDLTVDTKDTYYIFDGMRGHNILEVLLTNKNGGSVNIKSGARFEAVEAHVNKSS